MTNTGESSNLEAKLGQLLASACTAFGVALGSELGLFALLSKLPGPITSQELADAGGFKERYIREWLEQMACSQMVEFDPQSEKFYILPEKADSLNGAAPALLELLPIFGQRHEALKKCFQLSGPSGIPLSETPTTGIVMQRLRCCQNTLEELLVGEACVPGLQVKLGSGIFPRRMTELNCHSLLCLFFATTENGIVVADIGCGTGQLALQIAKAFPSSSVCAYDNDEIMLKIGRESARKENISNITFDIADIHKLPEDWARKFDYIVCYNVIHDLAWPQKALGELRRALKDDGTLTLVEPKINSSLKDKLLMGDEAAMYYTYSLYWCMSSSLAVEGSEGWGTTMGREIVEGMLNNVGLYCSGPIPLLASYYHFICTKSADTD